MSMRGTPASVGTALFVVAAAVAFYFSQQGDGLQTTKNIFVNATTTRTAQVRSVPAGWREYRNTAYRFSLLYPQELEVKEFPEKGNALTVTFQNSKEQKGFQIFIVPHPELQVSEERFKKDLPSGVRTDVTDVTIDGAIAAAFYSQNATLGETREIWFIRDGFLFEVTTLKSLATWLDAILRTWLFL